MYHKKIESIVKKRIEKKAEEAEILNKEVISGVKVVWIPGAALVRDQDNLVVSVSNDYISWLREGAEDVPPRGSIVDYKPSYEEIYINA